MFRVLSVFVLVLSFLSLFSCAQTLFTRPEAETMREAVSAYWTARVQMNPKVAYRYENMSFSFDEEYYTTNFYQYKVSIHEFGIVEIGGEGSGIKGSTPVKLRMTYSASIDKFPANKFNTEMMDSWIKREDGRWYHLIQGMKPDSFQ